MLRASMYHPFDPQRKFVQAHYFQRPLKPRVVTLLVVHSMEAPDRPSTAENVAAWFASPKSPEASAHACVDCDSVVTCVMPSDIAWACGATNWESYSLEIAGYAKWIRADWLSAANAPMLKLAAEHMLKAAAYFGIPAQILSEAEVAECLRDGCIRQGHMTGALSGNPGGVTTHVMANAAWKNWKLHGLPQPGPKVDLSHSDPGKGFPLDALVGMMQPALMDTEPPPSPRA